jgi:tRNA pseudouridine55 synthase
LKARCYSDIHGLVLLDKPEDVTSRQCVNDIQKVFSGAKAGHAGTLDPFATGLLPVCLGRATKLVEFVRSSKKTYTATLRLGISTDTQDITGKIIDRKKPPTSLTLDYIIETSRGFHGNIDQVPPMYSSLKQNGKRLYALARQQIEVARKPRRVQIYELTILDYAEPDISFSVTCSEGTYVRTLGVDIARKLESAGVITHLRRTQIGRYSVDQAVTMKTLQNTSSDRNEWLLPVWSITSHFPEAVISEHAERKFRNGALLGDADFINTQTLDGTNSLINIFTESGRFLGLAKFCGRDSKNKSVLKTARLIDI